MERESRRLRQLAERSHGRPCGPWRASLASPVPRSRARDGYTGHHGDRRRPRRAVARRLGLIRRSARGRSTALPTTTARSALPDSASTSERCRRGRRESCGPIRSSRAHRGRAVPGPSALLEPSARQQACEELAIPTGSRRGDPPPTASSSSRLPPTHDGDRPYHARTNSAPRGRAATSSRAALPSVSTRVSAVRSSGCSPSASYTAITQQGRPAEGVCCQPGRPPPPPRLRRAALR